MRHSKGAISCYRPFSISVPTEKQGDLYPDVTVQKPRFRCSNLFQVVTGKINKGCVANCIPTETLDKQLSVLLFFNSNPYECATPGSRYLGLFSLYAFPQDFIKKLIVNFIYVRKIKFCGFDRTGSSSDVNGV